MTGRPGVLRRIVDFPLTRIVIALVMIVAPILAIQLPLASRHFDRTPLVLPISVGLALVGWCGYRCYVAWIERRPPAEFAGGGALREVGGGVLLGVALFSATMGVLAAAGAYTPGPRHPAAVLIVPLAGSITSGVLEELVFRGVVFRILEASLGTWIALAISTSMFGIAHLANPGSGPLPAAAIAIEAGVLLTAAYTFTRRLWLPMGLHFAWNFTEAGIFGADVSGHAVPGLFTARFTGPAWLTGGAFGPEASVVAVVLCLAAGIVLLVRSSRRGRMLRPAWKRPRAGGVDAPIEVIA